MLLHLPGAHVSGSGVGVGSGVAVGSGVSIGLGVAVGSLVGVDSGIEVGVGVGVTSPAIASPTFWRMFCTASLLSF